MENRPGAPPGLNVSQETIAEVEALRSEVAALRNTVATLSNEMETLRNEMNQLSAAITYQPAARMYDNLETFRNEMDQLRGSVGVLVHRAAVADDSISVPYQHQ